MRLLILWCLTLHAFAQPVPVNAQKYLPQLDAQAAQLLPELAPRSLLAGQVEQETCITLKSRGCWSPRTELKTAREYGFGLGQLTVTSRFNNFNEVKRLDRELAGWQWENRYDPVMQLRALVVMDKSCRRYAAGAATTDDANAMMLACYNGGGGGLVSDRAVCRATPGCDPSRWWQHVERTSNKSRRKPKGYGKSFFEINREYPKLILTVRRLKYAEFFKE